MAMGGPVYKKSVKEQFERHHEALTHENKKYPDYEKYKKKYQAMSTSKPDLVEFGKVFDVAVNTANDQLLIEAAYGTTLRDYFKVKAENFPTWEGLPTIKVQEPTDALRRVYKIGWHVAVPKKFVIDQDQKLEEDLWNS